MFETTAYAIPPTRPGRSKAYPSRAPSSRLAKVESFTTVSDVSILGWATGSQQKALDNARAAAVECSRRRVERAEVDQALAELTATYAVPVPSRDVSLRATAR